MSMRVLLGAVSHCQGWSLLYFKVAFEDEALAFEECTTWPPFSNSRELLKELHFDLPLESPPGPAAGDPVYLQGG